MSMYFGGTVVGARTSDGVVIAADRRMSYGTFIASRNARKIALLDDRVALAFAGIMVDMGGLLRMLDTEFRLFTLSTGTKPTVYSVAKRLATILYSYKVLPFIVEAIVGGVDPDGTPRLYALDSLGSVTEEDFAATGSGATMAYGYLEAKYRKDLPLNELENIVLEALKAALRRDASSGDGIDAVVIARDGRVKRVSLRLALREVEAGRG